MATMYLKIMENGQSYKSTVKAILAAQPNSSPAPMKASSRKEQKAYVEGLIKSHHQLRTGDTWVLINLKWWKRWKTYINQESDKLQETNGEITDKIPEYPGPIDNTSLLEWCANGDVKVEDTEEVEVIPEDVWVYLSNIYGCLHVNYDQFKRIVIELPSGECSLEIHPFHLRVTLNSSEHGSKRFRQVILSRYSTLGHLQDIIRRTFEVPSTKRIRLSKRTNDSLENGSLIHVNDNLDGVALEDFLQNEDELLVESDIETSSSCARREDHDTDDPSPSFSNASGCSNDVNYMNGDSRRQIIRKHPGVCGLINLGNTCFMNSILQCLSSLQPLTAYFMKPSNWKHQINLNNPLGFQGLLVTAYGNLIQKFWSSQQTAISPDDFKVTLSKCAPQFSGYSQHDSQELLMFLLDGLHEDLNKAVKVGLSQRSEDDDKISRSDEELASEAWKQHKLLNDSIIIDLLHGLLKSRVDCPDCGHMSVIFDPFSCLSLPLPPQMEFKQKILFVPHDSAHLRAITLALSKRDTIATLLHALSQVVSVPPEECKVAKIVESKIFKYFWDEDSVAKFSSHDLICVYHLPDMGSNVTMEVLHIFDGRPVHIPILINLNDPCLAYTTLVQRLLPQLSSILEMDCRKNFQESGSVLDWPSHSEAASESSSEVEDDDNIEDSVPSYLNMSCFFDMDVKELTSYRSLFPGAKQLCLSPPYSVKLYLRWKSNAIITYTHSQQMSLSSSVANEISTSLKSISLNECLKLFTRPERLSESDLWFCSSCKTQKAGVKKFDLWSLPDLLIIHLKRFHNNITSRDKVDTFIDFPIKGLDLSEWVLRAHERQYSCVYDLICVSNHSGSLASGHYTTYALNFIDLNWYLYNDDLVTRVDNIEDIVSKEAYVLIYQRQKASMSTKHPTCEDDAKLKPIVQ